jgi:aldoxime dehydratase
MSRADRNPRRPRRGGRQSNRYLTVVQDGRPVERTFGMGWWRSLADLERWAESHPTHVAIFGVAMRYLSTLGPTARLRLYHEVSVVPDGEAFFEYVDCRPGTGLLGALPG